jgi:hypothetical protein
MVNSFFAFSLTIRRVQQGSSPSDRWQSSIRFCEAEHHKELPRKKILKCSKRLLWKWRWRTSLLSRMSVTWKAKFKEFETIPAGCIKICIPLTDSYCLLILYLSILLGWLINFIICCLLRGIWVFVWKRKHQATLLWILLSYTIINYGHKM